MSKWHFKQVIKQEDGSVNHEDLTEEQEARVDEYETALEQSLTSVVANPIFSGYHVKSSISSDVFVLQSGNIEYGFCQSLHGEETAISALRSVLGRDELDKIVLGLIAGEEGNVATPCGNCRDLLLDDLGTDFEIVSGAPEGGLALVTNMKDYLFDGFAKIKNLKTLPPLFENRVQTAIKVGGWLTNNAYSSGKSNRRYNALLKTQDRDFVGALDLMCEYHPIYPLRDAIRVARRAHTTHLDYVVIVAEESKMENPQEAPHVMYKERQHLLELNLQHELIADKEFDPPVYLVTVNRQNDGLEITNVWQTSVKEWLPLPFSPRNFGPEFVEHLTGYFKGETK